LATQQQHGHTTHKLLFAFQLAAPADKQRGAFSKLFTASVAFTMILLSFLHISQKDMQPLQQLQIVG
jgi:hypothetical protein